MPPLLVLLVVLVAWPATASAQYKIDSWTTEQGLPQATVIGVTQTPDGFLWGGTLGGLVRFDGKSFRVFDTATNPELSTSRLGSPLVTDEGELFVINEDRRLLRFHKGRFQVMGTSDGLPDATVQRIPHGAGKLLYVETTKGAVTWRNGRFVAETRPAPPASLGLRFIGDSATGAKWYVDRAGLALRYEGDRFTRSQSLPAERADLVYEDRAGRLWMRVLRTGELLAVIGNTVHRYGMKDGVGSISTMWVLEDADGTLWFAEQSGLVCFRDGRFRTYTKADGLPSNYVISVFRDREGTHWASTQGGLARLTEQPITTYSVEQGLVAKNTYPLLQDSRGDIWIGGWQGLTRYRNGTFENVTVASDVVNANVLSLAETRDGAILVGLYGTGSRRLTIRGPDHRISAAIVPKGPNIVYAIHQSRSGDVWFGADEGALRLHDGVFDPPLPQTTGVSAFYEDDHGALWIGNTAGLSRYANGVLTRFGATDGFSGRRVRMIHPAADGSLWLGTYDTGLFRYRNGKFSQFTTDQGLPANGAFQILGDQKQRFWISSNTGIYRVAKSDLDDVAEGGRRTVTVAQYGRDDGMANQECNGLGRPAGVRTADGRFWFPTQDGVVVLNPESMIDLPPPPVALDVLVNGRPAQSTDKVEVKFWSGAFEARYSALTFVRPELVKFKYKMEGVDTDWFDPGTTRMARYVGLPYGDFRFRVIAANRDGVWNEEGAGIAVIVDPPFWRTTWFMWLMAGVVMAAGLGTHRVRLGVLERKRALQQAFARQLLDSQETDRKRIASELHDGVSQTLVVIRNWSQMSGQSLPEDSAARKRLGDISNAASQALGEVREVVQDLVPYHLERVGLAGAMREAAARVADSSGIAITCACAELTGQLSTETSLRLFRVAQEGLNNVVKHSGATSASLDITVESGYVRLTMHDNGKGFDPKAVKPTTAGDGFGLVGMAERARMMGGDITIESAPGKGTTITIVVPGE